MKIGISYKGKSNNKTDFRNLFDGNPGVGGTIYLELLLASLLCEDKEYDPVLFTSSRLLLDDRIEQVIAQDEVTAIKLSKKHNIDILIFVAGTKNEQFYQELEKQQI